MKTNEKIAALLESIVQQSDETAGVIEVNPKTLLEFAAILRVPQNSGITEENAHVKPEPIEEPPFCDRCMSYHAGDCPSKNR
jgi:hypothetical protein